MLKPFTTCFGRIEDIQYREDLILITDSLEVEHILKDIGYLGTDEDKIEFIGLFILVIDGDYDEIYGFEGNVPYFSKNLWRIDYIKRGYQISKE